MTRRPASEPHPNAPASSPACPFCDGHETELSNAFGAHASVSTWWCRACRSPFERFKWGNHPDDAGAPREPDPLAAPAEPSTHPQTNDDDE